MREPKLIIPTTIWKFTAVDRNVFVRAGTKYTAEFLRRSFFPSSSFSLPLLFLFYRYFLAPERARKYQSKLDTEALPELESPWNEFFRALPLRERRTGDNSLSKTYHTLLSSEKTERNSRKFHDD